MDKEINEMKEEMLKVLDIIQELNIMIKVIGTVMPRNEEESIAQRKGIEKLYRDLMEAQNYYYSLQAQLELLKQKKSMAELKELILISCTIGFVILVLYLLMS